MGWVGDLWGRMTEGAARIVEAKRMSDAERQEWTAAVYMVRAGWEERARREARAESASGVAAFGTKVAAPRAAPRWVRDTWGTSPGPVYLAWEAHQAGLISQRQLDRATYDTVYWVTGVTTGAAPKLRRIARDFGTWKSSVAEQLEAFGLEDPRDDNRLRGWALGLLIAGAAVAATAAVVASGGLAAPAAAAVFASLGGAGGIATGTAVLGTVMYATADMSERTYNEQAQRLAGVEVVMEGSAVGTALAGGLGGAGAAYAGGQTKASDVAAAFAQGYANTAAAYGQPAPVAPPPPADSELVTWAKSTGGMITIGAIALLLVAYAARR
jgi:hypothetical protein